MVSELIYLAIALLLAPALGEIAKIRKNSEKGFTWIAAAGAMYLLAAAFTYEFWPGLGTSLAYGTVIFSVIGLIAVLIGALMVITSIFK